MDEEQIKTKIVELGPWFHQIEISPNLCTRDIAPSPGPQPIDNPLSRWLVLKDHLPNDMSGMRVLDVGCADGFFSIELAKRGAEVVAIDAAGKMIARLNWVIQQLGIKNITTEIGWIENLDYNETFDSILFLGLLYHLKSPLLGLEKLSKMTNHIYLETTIHKGDEPYLYLKPPQPGVHSIPKWFPTKSCVVEMMKYVGFQYIDALPETLPSRAMYIGSK